MLLLNYPSRIAEEDIIGRVVGPDMHGALYIAMRVGYPDRGRTRVWFRPLPADETLLVNDQWGQMRLAESKGVA